MIELNEDFWHKVESHGLKIEDTYAFPSEAVILSKNEYNEYFNWCITNDVIPIPDYIRGWVPTHLNNYEKAKWIMVHGPAFIKGSIIDMQSANVVIRIYEALSKPSLKKRLEDWPCFVDLALKCWGLAK